MANKFFKAVLAICIFLNLIECKGVHKIYTPPSNKPGTAVSCPDVEYMGLYGKSGTYSIDTDVPGVVTITAKLRNKASYTKTVAIEFMDGYGANKKVFFKIKAGEMIDGLLTTTSSTHSKIRDVRITACY